MSKIELNNPLPKLRDNLWYSAHFKVILSKEYDSMGPQNWNNLFFMNTDKIYSNFYYYSNIAITDEDKNKQNYLAVIFLSR